MVQCLYVTAASFECCMLPLGSGRETHMQTQDARSVHQTALLWTGLTDEVMRSPVESIAQEYKRDSMMAKAHSLTMLFSPIQSVISPVTYSRELATAQKRFTWSVVRSSHILHMIENLANKETSSLFRCQHTRHRPNPCTSGKTLQ
jgi:hypothetical protein